mmetsp:Transcript_6637/g.13163  ORF Transcript_6637/g.13163 Transcript_6637/m.13163 type:complete len:96 (+) Transcript_6637:112-399(+)
MGQFYHRQLPTPPGPVWVLKTTYKARDGTIFKRGQLVTEFKGHTFGIVPFKSVAITSLSYDSHSETWITSKSFEAIPRRHLKPVYPALADKTSKL